MERMYGDERLLLKKTNVLMGATPVEWIQVFVNE